MSGLSRPSMAITTGVIFGFAVSSSFWLLWEYWRSSKLFEPSPASNRNREIVDGVTGLIGNTPLVRIKSLSNALGVEILGKAEFLNPGGSVKDRVAAKILDDAEAAGLLQPYTGCRIFEGTVGSTGISLATLSAARGYETTIIIPDDVAAEKALALLALGAHIEKVRPASIVDKKQFVNLAKARAKAFTSQNEARYLEISKNPRSQDGFGRIEPGNVPKGFFADQFENLSNYNAHYEGTGPEIWQQTSGQIDAFVSGAGTGGTLAGIGCFLRKMHPAIRIVLADPTGSGLYNKIKEGVMYDHKESEGRKRRHQVDTVVEGIGINRLTRNFERAIPVVDDAIRVSDAEAVSMSRYIVKHDGLFLGSSSACNLVAAVQIAKLLPRGSRIVTILCDSGARHYSKFWNDEYLKGIDIIPDTSITEKMLE